MTEYAPGKTSLLRTITQGVNKPYGLAIGSAGYLFVANFANNTVTEYPPGKTSLLRTISQGVSGPMR